MGDLALPDPDDDGGDDGTLFGLARYEVERLVTDLIRIWVGLCGLMVVVAYLKS